MPIIIEEINVEVLPDEPAPANESSGAPMPAEAHGAIEMLSLIQLAHERKARLDCD
jgi:hypothetical protein